MDSLQTKEAIKNTLSNLLKIFTREGKIGLEVYPRFKRFDSFGSEHISEIHTVNVGLGSRSNSIALFFGSRVSGHYTSPEVLANDPLGSFYADVSTEFIRSENPFKLRLENNLTVNSLNLISFEYGIDTPREPYHPPSRDPVTICPPFRLFSSRIEYFLNCKGGFSCDAKEKDKYRDVYVGATTAKFADVSYDFRDPVQAAKFMVAFYDLLDEELWAKLNLGGPLG